MDATVQPKPIYISLNEIYTIHAMLLQHQSHLVSSRSSSRRDSLFNSDLRPLEVTIL
jgi:Ras GTPase-activating-like protein IQGAP2/3